MSCPGKGFATKSIYVQSLISLHKVHLRQGVAAHVCRRTRVSLGYVWLCLKQLEVIPEVVGGGGGGHYAFSKELSS